MEGLIIVLVGVLVAAGGLLVHRRAVRRRHGGVEAELTARGFEVDRIETHVRALFAAVQKARATGDPGRAREFLHPDVVGLPDFDLWLETLPADVDVSAEGLAPARRFPHEAFGFERAALIAIQFERLVETSDGRLTLEMRLRWALPLLDERRISPAGLPSEKEVLVRESLSLLSAEGTWLVTRFEISADLATSQVASSVFRKFR